MFVLEFDYFEYVATDKRCQKFYILEKFVHRITLVLRQVGGFGRLLVIAKDKRIGLIGYGYGFVFEILHVCVGHIGIFRYEYECFLPKRFLVVVILDALFEVFRFADICFRFGCCVLSDAEMKRKSLIICLLCCCERLSLAPL